MNVKSASPAIEALKQTLAAQHGTLTSANLAEMGISRTYLTILQRRGEIERVSRGVYRAANAMEDELFAFQAVYKAAIYSHQTALFLHDLTDRSPLVYSISVPVGYHAASLNRNGHQVFYVRREQLDIGVTTIRSPHGNPLRVTGLERTICDVVRSRNQLDSQLVFEALRRYGNRKERDLNTLFEQAKRFRIQNRLREMLEILL